jgi:hypothetical protein
MVKGRRGNGEMGKAVKRLRADRGDRLVKSATHDKMIMVRVAHATDSMMLIELMLIELVGFIIE